MLTEVLAPRSPEHLILVSAMIGGAAVAALRARTATPAVSGAPLIGLLAPDRETEIGHVLMLLAMAAMLTVSGLPTTIWLWVFGLLTAHYVWRFFELRRRGLEPRDDQARRRAQLLGIGYHALGAFAMLYSMLGNEPNMTAMHHNHKASVAGHFAHPPGPWFGWLLVGIFVLDAATTLGAAAFPRSFSLPTLTLGDRIGTAPHLVMDLAMALTLSAVL